MEAATSAFVAGLRGGRRSDFRGLYNLIGIVDDHVLIREGVKKILQKTSDMEVIAETDNILQLFRLIPDSARAA